MKDLYDRPAWFRGGSVRCATVPAVQGRFHRLVLLGAPGVGKATQAEMLCQRSGACRLSTGDVFRAAAQLSREELSPEMAAALEHMRRGELAPDEAVLAVVRRRVRCLQCSIGFVLEGFPRTVRQAEGLEELLETGNMALTAAIHYQAPLDQIITRLAGRRTCPMCKAVFHLTERPPKVPGLCDQCDFPLYQRNEDKPEAIGARIKAYERNAVPLLDFYRSRGLLISIEAGPPRETCERTLAALAETALELAGA